MTNTEYERACINAVDSTQSEGERKLAFLDREIAILESTMVDLLHARREIINRYNLNKGHV